MERSVLEQKPAQHADQLIFRATIVIWFLQTFDTRFNVVADSGQSMLAGIGRFIAPVFTPLGFNDWRASTALITGFSAKEAVVSTLAVLTGGNTATLPATLSQMFAWANWHKAPAVRPEQKIA